MSFEDEILSYVGRTRRKIINVKRDATKELVRRAQLPVSQGGNMHVNSGFLRASIRASLTQMPSPVSGAEPEEGSMYKYTPAGVNAVIDTAELDDTIYIGWTASYAGIREHRDGFMRLAAQQWQSIVRSVAGKLK